MGKGFFNKWKKPLFPSIIKPVTSLTKKVVSDVRHGVNEVEDAIVHHPVQSAIIGGSVLLGGIAIAASGGILTPEVAVVEESVIGTEVAAIGTEAAVETAAASEFVAVDVAATEPELASFTQAQNLLENPEMVEQVVDLGPIEPIEPVIEEPLPEVDLEPIPEEEPVVMEEQEVALDDGAEPLEDEFVDPEEIPKDHPYHPDNIDVEPELPADSEVIEQELPNKSEFQELDANDLANEIPDGNPDLKGDLEFEDIDDVLNDKDFLDLDEPVMNEEELADLQKSNELKEFNELQAARGREQIAEAMANRPSMISQILSKGRAGLRLVNQVSDQLVKVATLGAGVTGLVTFAKSIKNEKTRAGQLKKTAELINKAKNLHAQTTGTESKNLDDVSKGLDQLGDGVGHLEENINTLTNLAQTSHINRTHNDTINENIQENKGEMENVKNSDKVLDSNLQGVVIEQKKEIDAINDLKNTIDKPQTPDDFINELDNYNSKDSKMDFIADNYETFSTFSDGDKDRILGNIV